MVGLKTSDNFDVFDRYNSKQRQLSQVDDVAKCEIYDTFCSCGFCIFLYTVHPPICGLFISEKSVHKSGFVHKSGVDKSGDALYLKSILCLKITQKRLSDLENKYYDQRKCWQLSRLGPSAVLN